MNAADTAQCAALSESIRLGELKETLSQLEKTIDKLAYAEITDHLNVEVGTQIHQAQMKLQAAIQTINFQLRSL